MRPVKKVQTTKGKYTYNELLNLSKEIYPDNFINYNILSKRINKGITDFNSLIKPFTKNAKTGKYNNVFYVADFETSTDENTNTCGAYLACMVSCDFTSALNSENPFNFIRREYDCRYPQELGRKFYELYNYSKSRKFTTIIYFHNLGFDFSFSKNWHDLMSKIQIEKCFSDGSNPWRLCFGEDNKTYLELRCSLKLLNRSLAVIGDMIGHKKLGYDYDEFRLPTDKLNDYDYEYCYNDCAVTACGIIEECKNWEWIKSIKDIPLTFTSFSRKNNKYIIDKKMREAWKYYCVDTFPENYEQYELYRNTYSGGYTHANTFFRCKLLKLVHSFDVCSDYPAQSMQMYFPHDNGKLYKGERLKKVWNTIYNLCKKSANDNIYHSASQNYVLENTMMFHGIFIFKNIKIKQWKYNYMPLISSSKVKTDKNIKIDNYIKTYEKLTGYEKLNKITSNYKQLIDNGRILSYDEILVYATEVDIVNYMRMYDIEEIIPIELYISYAKKSGGLKELVERNIIYADMKTAIKSISNKKEIPKGISEDSIPLKWRKEMQNSDDKSKIAKRYLRLAKSLFNAQYGIDATQLVFGNCEIDDDEIISTTDGTNKETFDKYFSEDIIFNSKAGTDNTLKNKTKSSYIVGMYITAYARRHLVLLSQLIFENTDYNIVYWDTDSIKVYKENDTKEDFEKLSEIVNKFNNSIKSRCKKCDDKRVSKNLWGLGYFDYEETYAMYTTMNSKRYMSYDLSGLDVKTSGLVQATHKINIILQELNKKYNDIEFSFRKLMKILWKTNTYFDKSISGRTYLDRQNQGVYSKLFGQYCGAVITNTDYEFKTYEKYTENIWNNQDAIKIHYDIVSQEIFSNKVNRNRTAIYCIPNAIVVLDYDEKGNKEILYCPCDTTQFKHGKLLSDMEEDLSEIL